MGFTVEGFSPKPGESAGSLVNAVSPGYFEALRRGSCAAARFDGAGRAHAARGRGGLALSHRRSSTRRSSNATSAAAIRSAATSASATIPARRCRSRSSASSPTASTQAIREDATSADLPAGVREPRPEQRHGLPPQPRCRRRRSWPACAGVVRRLDPGAAGVQRGDARRARRPLAPQRAARRRPVGRVRDAGDAARRRRALRRDDLHRHAALARDRHPHGARRARGSVVARPCRARGGPARSSRGLVLAIAGGVVAQALHRHRALRRQARRSADARARRDRPDRGRPARRRPSRPDAPRASIR